MVSEGWCVWAAWCGGVGVECVSAPGFAMKCVACAAQVLGLPAGTDAAGVVGELERRSEGSGT